jgi:hypothetical protein
MKLYSFSAVPGNMLAGQMVTDRFHTWDFNTVYRQYMRSYGTTSMTFEREVDNIGHKLAVYAMGWFYCMRECLDWTITAHTSPIIEEGEKISPTRGAMIIADSKKAMIKGLRKLEDLKKTAPGYVLQCDQGLGIAAAELEVSGYGTTSSVVAALKNVSHNTREKLKRTAIKTVYNILPQAQQKVFAKYVTENISIDHYYSVSGGMEEAKDNKRMSQMGYAVYVAPSEFMPCSPNNGVCNRVIGNVLTCGQIAAFLQKSGDFDKRVGGIFN